MDQSVIQRQGLLKKALTVNAVFSVFSCVVILLANRWLVQFLGLSDQISLTILGVSLIIFATILWLNARRPRIRIVDAWVPVIMDAAWVVGSYTLIFLVPFSVGGKWVIALVAEVVLAFAILQWIGIRPVRTGERYA